MKRVVSLLLAIALMVSVYTSAPAYAAASAKSTAAATKVALKATNAAEGIQLTWSSTNEKAMSGYQVFRFRAGKPVLVKTTSGTTKTWTDKDVIPGKTYSYKVRGFIKDGTTRRFTNLSKKVTFKCEALLSNESITISKGETANLSLTGPSGEDITSGSEVTWTSKDSSVASVSEGIITGVGSGSTIICAKYHGKTYKCYANVCSVVTFQEIMEKAKESNLERRRQSVPLEQIKKYAVYVEDDANLITEQEVKSLIEKTPRKTEANRRQALADIDLLFRTLKSSSATYYYFGADNFRKAEKEIKAWINSQNSVNVERLEKKISKAVSFYNDAHCWIAMPNEDREGYVYDYYYPIGSWNFARDSEGYYTFENGEKWYVEKFSAEDVFMDARLLPDGTLVYSPVCCTARTKYKESCFMTLQSTSGRTKKVTVKWLENRKFSNVSLLNPDFSYFSENGLTYITIRSFSGDVSQLEAFAKSGLKARNSAVLILDVRSNGGGSDAYIYDFFKNLTGQRPEVNECGIYRGSMLANALGENFFQLGNGKYRIGTNHFSKTLLKNDIPIIILTDNLCGSAGESVIKIARCYENVMVVGSNSAGYQLSGNAMNITLPNTGICAFVAPRFWLTYDGENVEGKGRYPDVWVNPKYVLPAVFSMIQKYGIYTDESAIHSIESRIPKSNMNIYGILNGKDVIQNGCRIDAGYDPHFFYFYDDCGQTIKNYSYSVSPSGLKVKKESDGKLTITTGGDKNKYTITITPETGSPLIFTFREGT